MNHYRNTITHITTALSILGSCFNVSKTSHNSRRNKACYFTCMQSKMTALIIMYIVHTRTTHYTIQYSTVETYQCMRSWGQQQSSIFENMPINRRYSRKRDGKRITCAHIPENVNLCYASTKSMQEVLIEKPLHHWFQCISLYSNWITGYWASNEIFGPPSLLADCYRSGLFKVSACMHIKPYLSSLYSITLTRQGKHFRVATTSGILSFIQQSREILLEGTVTKACTCL